MGIDLIEVWVASSSYEAENDEELSYANGDQVLVRSKGEDERSEYLYGEHASDTKSRRGWFLAKNGSVWQASLSGVDWTSPIQLHQGTTYAPADVSYAAESMSSNERDTALKLALDNIVKIEQDYVEGLGVLVAGLVSPLEQRDVKYKSTLLENSSLNALMGQLRDLFVHHSGLLRVIRERQANWSPTPQYLLALGAAFSEIASRFELYTDYLKNQGPLMEALSDKSIAELMFLHLKENPLPPYKNMQIDQLLKIPLVQYREYRWMLEVVVALIPEADKGTRTALEQCVGILQAATLRVDNAAEEGAREMELLAIQKLFVGRVEIFQHGRRLVHAGKLFLMTTKDGSRKEERFFHAFNDIIVYSKPRGKRLQFRKSIPLLGTSIEDVADTTNGINCFDLVGPDGKHSRFQANNSETKMYWLKVITDLIQKAQFKKDEANRRLMRDRSDRASRFGGGGGGGGGAAQRKSFVLNSQISEGDMSKLFDRSWDARGAPARVLAAITLFEMHKEHTQELGQVVKSFIIPLEDVRKGASIGAGHDNSSVKGTSSSLSVNLYNIKTTFKKSNTKVLQENPDVAVFLKTVIDLNKMHMQLLAGLDKALGSALTGGGPLALGGILSPVAERLFESYAWVVNSACKTLLGGTFKDFSKVTDTNLATQGRGATTESTLGRVLPHISVVITGLDDLVSKTAASDEDKAVCDEMLERFKDIDGKVKETIIERRNFDKLAEIKNSIYSVSLRSSVLDDTFVSKKRKFCREGTLVKVCRSANKPFMFWLLSDYLIYASPVANGSYTLNQCIELSECRVYSRDYEGQPAFEVLSANKTFIAICANSEIRDLWFNDLEDNIGNLMNTRRGSFVNRDSLVDKDGAEIKEVSVIGWEERTEEPAGTYYKFQCTTWGGQSWTVLKRYSEVLALHNKMKAGLGHESLKNFPFPVKSMFNSGDKLKTKRKVSFELYFRLVLELETIPLDVGRFFGEGRSDDGAPVMPSSPQPTASNKGFTKRPSKEAGGANPFAVLDESKRGLGAGGGTPPTVPPKPNGSTKPPKPGPKPTRPARAIAPPTGGSAAGYSSGNSSSDNADAGASRRTLGGDVAPRTPTIMSPEARMSNIFGDSSTPTGRDTDLGQSTSSPFVEGALYSNPYHQDKPTAGASTGGGATSVNLTGAMANNPFLNRDKKPAIPARPAPTGGGSKLTNNPFLKNQGKGSASQPAAARSKSPPRKGSKLTDNPFLKNQQAQGASAEETPPAVPVKPAKKPTAATTTPSKSTPAVPNRKGKAVLSLDNKPKKPPPMVPQNKAKVAELEAARLKAEADLQVTRAAAEEERRKLEADAAAKVARAEREAEEKRQRDVREAEARAEAEMERKVKESQLQRNASLARLKEKLAAEAEAAKAEAAREMERAKAEMARVEAETERLRQEAIQMQQQQTAREQAAAREEVERAKAELERVREEQARAAAAEEEKARQAKAAEVRKAREELERIREEARLAKLANEERAKAEAAAEVERAKAELAALREEAARNELVKLKEEQQRAKDAAIDVERARAELAQLQVMEAAEAERREQDLKRKASRDKMKADQERMRAEADAARAELAALKEEQEAAEQAALEEIRRAEAENEAKRQQAKVDAENDARRILEEARREAEKARQEAEKQRSAILEAAKKDAQSMRSMAPLAPSARSVSPASSVSAKVLFEFEADDDEWQISVQEGETVAVIEQNDDGWWEVTAGGRTGCVPGSYLEIVKEPSRRGFVPPPPPGKPKKEAAPVVDTPAETSPANDNPYANDPQYSKFFKMLQMHLPLGAVEQKMRSEGLDPSVLGGGDSSSGGGGGALTSADGTVWKGRTTQPAPPPNKPAGGGGGGGGGGMGGLLAGIQAGASGLRSAADRPADPPRPAPAAGGMSSMLAAIQGGVKLNKVTAEQIAAEKAAAPVEAPTGIMGAMAAALGNIRDQVHSDSDSSSDDEAEWSASDGGESD